MSFSHKEGIAGIAKKIFSCLRLFTSPPLCVGTAQVQGGHLQYVSQYSH